MPEEEKLFYTIGEAAQMLNVKPYVLRYWETEFKKLNPQKSEKGQRTFLKKDLQVAVTIKRLLYDEKYTIAGAIQKLEELEKEGLDQLDMFGIKTPAQQKIGSAPLAQEASAPEPVMENNAPKFELKKTVSLPAPVKPAISREKVMELKNLIEATYSILKKYHLN